MNDDEILDLYWARSERALSETADKYGNYLKAVALRILSAIEDAEESVNDTYLRAWNAIPPDRPSVLRLFLGKITRRLALNRLRERQTAKRGGGEVPAVLDELSECVPSGQNVENEILARELAETIASFVSGLPEDERRIFILRVYELMPVKEIAERLSFSESKVKTTFFRTRKKLAGVLKKEGV
ncbi:MAG: RNA polymerase sigma factor [Lachnospiraceae bacterium]|nr:RNA polymerase sigma factor [Lachnospiraceae bacterium]